MSSRGQWRRTLPGLWEPPGNRAAITAAIAASVMAWNDACADAPSGVRPPYWLYRARWVLGGDLSDLVMMTQFVDILEAE